MNKQIVRLTLILTLFITACKKDPDNGPVPVPPPPPVVLQDNAHNLLGNPTNPQVNMVYKNDFYLDHTYWVASYSDDRGIPLWVSWHLQSSDLGSTPRQDDFRYDNILPSGFYLVQNNSYSGSGFDRGHNCPSADRTSSIAANSSTFYMTNMIPQAPKFNQGPWEGLESFIRSTLVGSSNEAYIVMGNYGNGGVASSAMVTAINNGKVTVPSHVWKAVVVLPKGNGDLARLDGNATVLVVNMPNNNTLYSTTASGKNAWRNYLTTLDNLEQESTSQGAPINFLKNVDPAVKEVLKNKLYQ